MDSDQRFLELLGVSTEQNFLGKTSSNSILLQALLDIKNHLVVTDVDGRIVFANKVAQEKTSFTLEEMRGKTPALWAGSMEAGGEVTNHRKNGETYYAIRHTSPIFGESKTVIGYIHI